MARNTPELPPLVGQAPAFLDLMEQVSRVAPLDRPVLVIGERGTGKELIAARLHYLSPRWDRPLLKLNAAALPETLVDSLAFDVLTVPPLRARREDIALLAEHFGRAMAHDLGWPAFPGFAVDALDELLAHPWPGNVRELRNVVERAVYRAGSPARRIVEVQFDPFASPFRPTPAQDEPARSDHAAARDRRGGARELHASRAPPLRRALAP